MSRRGREDHPKVWEGLRSPPGGSDWVERSIQGSKGVGRPTRMSGSGQEGHLSFR